MAKAGKNDDVLAIEKLMASAANVVPAPAIIAECLLGISLLQELTADGARARSVFEKAAQLTARVQDGDNSKADLLTLAAEVKLRTGHSSEATEWLHAAYAQAARLEPTSAFNTTTRLARIALAAGALPDLRTILNTAQDAIRGIRNTKAALQNTEGSLNFTPMQVGIARPD